MNILGRFAPTGDTAAHWAALLLTTFPKLAVFTLHVQHLPVQGQCQGSGEPSFPTATSPALLLLSRSPGSVSTQVLRGLEDRIGRPTADLLCSFCFIKSTTNGAYGSTQTEILNLMISHVAHWDLGCHKKRSPHGFVLPILGLL